MSEAKFGEPWKCHSDAFHTMEGSPSGWNKAWRGQSDRESKQIIEFVAESPLDALALAERTVASLNALAGIDDPEAFVKAHRELVEAVSAYCDYYGDDDVKFGELLGNMQTAIAACEAAEGKEKV